MKMTRRLCCLVLALILVALSAITLTASADTWVGDFRLSDDQKILIQYAGTDTAPAIPATVKTIGAAAFKDNQYIETITVPNTVTEIRDRAFYNCSALKTVTLPNTIGSIPAGTFAYCGKLETVNIPRSVTTIGAEAFKGCAYLQNLIGPDQQSVGSTIYRPVPAYVTNIGASAFDGCEHLTIQCFKGSAMETYCVNNKLQYTSVEPLIYKLTATKAQWTTVWAKGKYNTVQLSVTIDPTIAASNKLGWSPNDVSILKVNESGLVTSTNNPGLGIVTCYSPDQLDVSIEIPVVILDSRKTWQSWGGNWYYCTGTGASSFAVGWKQIGKPWYYFNQYGIMLTGWQKIDGKIYFLNADGKMQDGWYNPSGYDWFFFESGALVTGWKKIGTKWYYFEPNGTMGTDLGLMYYGGVYTIGDKKYAFDSNGALMEGGWKKIGTTWYYFGTDGSPVTGWLKDKGIWYYLDPGTGAMTVGWRQIAGVWYYFDANGAMKTGWIKDGGKWYYCNSNGSLKTGWFKYNNKWYWLKAGNGEMAASEFVTVDGATYYFTAGGDMVTGWKQIGGDWYYFQSSGAMKYGWLKESGKWYYLQSDGRMAASVTLYIDGAYYTFNASGVWVP